MNNEPQTSTREGADIPASEILRLEIPELFQDGQDGSEQSCVKEAVTLLLKKKLSQARGSLSWALGSTRIYKLVGEGRTSTDCGPCGKFLLVKIPGLGEQWLSRGIIT